MDKPSELFSEICKTRKRKYLYNIMPISNIPSVLMHGIICKNKACKLKHSSIAMEQVQQIRDGIKIPNGLYLHEYANLYFTYNNAMLYKRKDKADLICILAVNPDVLDIENCVVSDGNAASSYVSFYPPLEGLQALDFSLIDAQYWNHPDDYYKTRNHKIRKCAEVLIPEKIPINYIKGAYVVDEKAKNLLTESGFDRSKIIVDGRKFYR